jgi:hypothetical protein
MKRWFSISLLSGLLGVSIPSYAQQCGYGAQDGSQCVPADQVPGYQDSLQDRQAQPQQPQAVWVKRWGAIAIDNGTSSVGVSENQVSKSAARTEALQRCTSKSNSQRCEVQLAYYNQCAALAWGTGFYGTSGAADTNQAKEHALERCAKGAADCKIVYNACSLPTRVQ